VPHFPGSLPAPAALHPLTRSPPLSCRLGIIPGAGGTQRLPRLIGRAAAKELIFTCRKVSGRQAQQLGLVDHCVGEGGAYAHALSLAAEMAQVGRRVKATGWGCMPGQPVEDEGC
jgi:enoyl-CoA hydratase/carnithine racemase